MSLQEKLDYLEMINDMVLNYAKDNPDVADFLLKNKTVVNAEIILELKLQEISYIGKRISMNNKMIEELRQENEYLMSKFYKEKNNFFNSEEDKIIGLKELIEKL